MTPVRTVLLVALTAGAAIAQEQPDTSIDVLAVTGKAQHRAGPDAPWQELTTDSDLSVGSEIRTGLKSSATLRIGANSEVEVKSLTTIGVAQLTVDQDSGEIRTRVAKKYGTMRAQVKRVGNLENDYRITTPSGALAVRGSGGEHFEFGESWYVFWYDGSTEFFTTEGQHTLTEGAESNKNNPNPNAPPINLTLLSGQSANDSVDQQGNETVEVKEGSDSQMESENAAGGSRDFPRGEGPPIFTEDP